MTASHGKPSSLMHWMLESPYERLGTGLILPLVVLLGFIVILLVGFGGESDIVYYDTESGRLVDRAAHESDDSGRVQRRVRITYWEKWSGFEGQAIRDAVDHFNRMQDRIYVQLVIQGDITQKIRTATAGGNPPDLAGLYSFDVPVFAAQNALIALDDMLAEAGIGEHTYVPAYWRLCRYRSRTWALPTTPSTWALHWNRRLFREAGLPDRAPRTLQELDEFARRLTRRDSDGHITQVGFMPTEPGWWKWPWGFWFGGRLWNGRDRLTFNSPENLAAMEWIRSYVDEYGYEALHRFKKTLGGFSSVDNGFFNGRVAMEIQGVWMARFVQRYAPSGFEYGVAPFPSAVPGVGNVTVAEADVIGIPRGARHPREAFEFLRFMASPEGMEILCRGQGKHSPLRNHSANWYVGHPNPYLRVFEDLAGTGGQAGGAYVENPNCFRIPPIGIWRECNQAWGRAFDDVWTRTRTPREALDELQEQMQRRLDHELSRARALGVQTGEGE